MHTRVEDAVSGASWDSGFCRPSHAVLVAAPWQPSMPKMCLFFSPAVLPALEHGEAAPPQTPGSWVSVPPEQFPALWFRQLTCCLVCLDEKVGNMPKHPISPGVIFALPTVSGPDFHGTCL